jgi:hypothetical protein
MSEINTLERQSRDDRLSKEIRVTFDMEEMTSFFDTFDRIDSILDFSDEPEDLG